ncbi:hypothetical protein HED63_23235 [Ochrobactrum cytisi]|nr:hypothetical protein [Brucella cytisi]
MGRWERNGCSASTGIATTACLSGAHARDLTVVGFGGAIRDAFREAYFAPYAKEKGIKVLEDTTNGGLAKQKAMVDAGNVTGRHADGGRRGHHGVRTGAAREY